MEQTLQRMYLTPAQVRALINARNRRNNIHPVVHNVPPPKPNDPPFNKSLRERVPEILDQGTLGSCTMQSIRYATDIEQYPNFTYRLCRLAGYWKERLAEGQNPSDMQDSGANAMDGLSILEREGICDESLWPYNDQNGEVPPPSSCFEPSNCLPHRAHQVGTIANPDAPREQILAAIKQAITNNVPVITGIAVYSSFESPTVARNGEVPMPSPGEQFLGGHCITITGVDEINKRLELVNSWGAQWGQHGFCYLPFDYIKPQLMYDFVAVTRL